MPIYRVTMDYAKPGFHLVQADNEEEADRISRRLPPPTNGRLSPLQIKKTKARKGVVHKEPKNGR